MGAATILAEVTLETTSCCNCGINFAAPDWFLKSRRQDGKGFYCPNGHGLSWHETEADRLRKQLNEQVREATRQSERARQAEERAAKAERKLKRVARGTCPECNRSFANLARHMACKHEAPIVRVGAKPLP